MTEDDALDLALRLLKQPLETCRQFGPDDPRSRLMVENETPVVLHYYHALRENPDGWRRAVQENPTVRL
jgi:hypothetical protein